MSVPDQGIGILDHQGTLENVIIVVGIRKSVEGLGITVGRVGLGTMRAAPLTTRRAVATTVVAAEVLTGGTRVTLITGTLIPPEVEETARAREVLATNRAAGPLVQRDIEGRAHSFTTKVFC